MRVIIIAAVFLLTFATDSSDVYLCDLALCEPQLLFGVEY